HPLPAAAVDPRRAARGRHRRRGRSLGEPVTSPIVVGCAATPAGRDAMALGARLATATGAPLVLTFVLPTDMHAVLPPATRGPEARAQAEAWLTDAAASLPATVSATTQVRTAESFAQGLVDAAHIIDARLIVVGAANGGLRGR